ncbi:hypothetical protein SOCE26_083510 [Sorangium cellulosum]|uniref:Uncharacterized protein n=1 Tax=Sorangium cellulosum TaxID=56 RepID=A0A2L0F5N0_SORCE|nr:DUF5947 family protein [Sorangium cellulosum]AUX46842.1 hypothetical protein SOCE26_083510 [Sorangium cellulosum]
MTRLVASPGVGRALARLRAFTAAEAAPARAERCDICGVPLPGEHRHLLERAASRLRCACVGCAITAGGRADDRFRAVEPRCERLAGASPSDARWQALGIPIGLAFLQRVGDGAEVIARYPSPAGLVRSPVDPEAWSALVADYPALDPLQPEVEALLVRRLHGARDHYLVSIDECFRLGGILRRGWRGLGGGDVWAEVDRFFAQLRSRADGARRA